MGQWWTKPSVCSESGDNVHKEECDHQEENSRVMKETAQPILTYAKVHVKWLAEEGRLEEAENWLRVISQEKDLTEEDGIGVRELICDIQQKRRDLSEESGSQDTQQSSLEGYDKQVESSQQAAEFQEERKLSQKQRSTSGTRYRKRSSSRYHKRNQSEERTIQRNGSTKNKKSNSQVAKTDLSKDATAAGRQEDISKEVSGSCAGASLASQTENKESVVSAAHVQAGRCRDKSFNSTEAPAKLSSKQTDKLPPLTGIPLANMQQTPSKDTNKVSSLVTIPPASAWKTLPSYSPPNILFVPQDRPTLKCDAESYSPLHSGNSCGTKTGSSETRLRPTDNVQNLERGIFANGQSWQYWYQHSSLSSLESEDEEFYSEHSRYEYGAAYRREKQKFAAKYANGNVEEKTWFENSLGCHPFEDADDQLPCPDSALDFFCEERFSEKKPIYKQFLQPDDLEVVVRKNPRKYRRCQLKIISAHRSVAKILDSGSEFSEVLICGRSKCGQTYMDDEVIVEVLAVIQGGTIEANRGPLGDPNNIKKVAYGQVIGLTKRVRYADVKHPVLVCTLEPRAGYHLLPVCKTVPKVCALNEEVRARFPHMTRHKVEIKTIDENGFVKHKQFLNIDPDSREQYVFKVVILCWKRHFAYPLGAVLDVYKAGRSYPGGLRVLCMEHKVPKTFPQTVVIDTESIKNSQGHPKSRQGRRDLTSRRVFTIDPLGSKDLDDALSIWKEGDNRVVGVHIADVAALVKKGTAIDSEARKRGVSFYPLHRNPHPMLPEPLSNDLLSLLPDQDRLAVSVFFKFDEAGERMNCAEPLIERTIIRSRRKFSYAEAQRVINNQPPSDDDADICEDVRQLHRITSRLRKERLKDRRFFMPFEDPRLKDLWDSEGECFEAHALVEELMVLTNTSVAHRLKSRFPDVMLLLCQKSPAFEERGKWLEKEGNVAHLVLKLQGKMASPDSELSVRSGLALHDRRVIVQSDLWGCLSAAVSSEDYSTAKRLAFTDAVHSLQCLASEHWQHMIAPARYKCSYGLSESDHHHFGLDIACYTHFTSPIRRYADLHVQRLLHVDLDGQTPDCTSEEVIQLCAHLNGATSRQAAFEKRCVALAIAEKIQENPLVFRAYVDNIDHEQITVCLPSLLHVRDRVQQVPFSMLGISAQPCVNSDARGRLSDVTVMWNTRIYNTAGTCPREITLQHERDAVPNLSRPLIIDINSRQLTVEVNERAWAEVLQAFLEEPHGAIELPWGMSDDKTGVDRISSEKGDGRASLRPVHFKMKISPGQVLPVQMSADVERGVLTPRVELVKYAENATVCTRHLKNPVSSLSRSSADPTRGKFFRSYNSYTRAWLSLLEMEAATEAASSKDAVVIERVKIQLKKESSRPGPPVYRGRFSLPLGFCFERCIEIGGKSTYATQEDDENSYDRNEFPLDYLCIRYWMECEEPTVSQVQESIAKCVVDDQYVWVGHGGVMAVDQDRHRNKEEGQIDISFILNYNCLPPPDRLLLGKGDAVTIEILPKSPVSRQAQEMLFRLEDHDHVIARAIAFGETIPELDSRHLSLGNLIENHEVNIRRSERSLLPNNKKQQKAIRTSLTNAVTVIQGPPGTGKTYVSVKLVYLFNKINRLLEKEGKGNKRILFCGPSNKSVDLVAGLLMEKLGEECPKIIRVYGAAIESNDYPDPRAVLGNSRGIKNIKSDPSLKDISLHHVIRQAGKPHAEKIRRYDEKFRRYMQDPENIKQYSKEVREYRKLLYDASVEELGHYEVIISTCSAGASRRIVKGAKGSVFQVIIDECAMSTEPHSLVPIVANKAKQVVLIGDHKQLQPVIQCKQAALLGLNQSLFERLFNKSKFKKVFLTEQYRMHPQICEFPSNEFYEGKLKTSPSVLLKQGQPLPFWPSTVNGEKLPHILVDVCGEEKTLSVATDEGNERSTSNEKEAQKVVEIVKFLRRIQRIPMSEIQILTQYNAQRHLINRKLVAERTLIQADDFEKLECSTVVSSQGGEWNYVILSTVRSLPPYMIERCPTDGWCGQYMGFITDQNQINVALTRARRGLIIVGNAELLQCDKVWGRLLEQYKSKGCVLKESMFPPAARQ